MTKNRPVKKEYLLIVGGLLLFLLCYQLAFKDTIAAWQLNRELTGQLLQDHDLGYQPEYLERKSRNLDTILNIYRSDTVLFRNNTISRIAALADKNQVKLTEVPIQEAMYHTDRTIIQKLSFEGDFFALNSFLNQLESISGAGVPRSVVFRSSRKEGEPDRKKLSLEVYMEIRK